MKKDSEFIKTFNLPYFQMHYKPEKIVEMDDEHVTLSGREGYTNMRIRIKVTRPFFDSMVENYPESGFLLEEFGTQK